MYGGRRVQSSVDGVDTPPGQVTIRRGSEDIAVSALLYVRIYPRRYEPARVAGGSG